MGFNAREHAMTSLTLDRSVASYLNALSRALGHDVPVAPGREAGEKIGDRSL
jgi:hypothetical protein